MKESAEEGEKEVWVEVEEAWVVLISQVHLSQAETLSSPSNLSSASSRNPFRPRYWCFLIVAGLDQLICSLGREVDQTHQIRPRTLTARWPLFLLVLLPPLPIWPVGMRMLLLRECQQKVAEYKVYPPG